MEEVKKDAFPVVESAVEISVDMHSVQRMNNTYDQALFLKQKKHKKQRKALWYGLYDFFMCKRCSEQKK